MNRKSQICNLTHRRLETKLQSSKQGIDGIDLSTQKEVMLASFSERILVFGQNQEYFPKPKIIHGHCKIDGRKLMQNNTIFLLISLLHTYPNVYMEYEILYNVSYFYRVH